MLLLVTKSHPEIVRHAHPHLGRLIQPRHYSSIEKTANASIPWAADNDCFQVLDADAFTRMLDRIQPLPGCLFVTCPDFVGDHEATLVQFYRWSSAIKRRGLPIAFVLQDGCTVRDVPWLDIDAVFIGGTTHFKLGATAERIVLAARERGKWVHMGRVNSEKRIRYAEEIGCDSVDGSGWAMFNQTHLDRGLNATRQAAHRQRQERIAL